MKYRNRVLGLVSLLIVITYLDRVCMSVAGPRIQGSLHIGPVAWGWVSGIFTFAYAAFGWRLDLVSIVEADTNEPIDHHEEWQHSEDGEEDGAAQGSGKDLLLAEEKRACCDEKSKAHGPDVTRDTLPARRLAANAPARVSVSSL